MAAKKEEILRLVAIASEEIAIVEFQATTFCALEAQLVSWLYHYAVCMPILQCITLSVRLFDIGSFSF